MANSNELIADFQHTVDESGRLISIEDGLGKFSSVDDTGFCEAESRVIDGSHPIEMSIGVYTDPSHVVQIFSSKGLTRDAGTYARVKRED